MEPLKVELRCFCGQVRAKVDAPSPIHVVCYCDDCQGYAAWLASKQSPNNTRKVVDVQGGLRVCQVFGSDIEVLQGREKLEATVLDPALVPKGRPHELLRVHSTCCMTPMFSSSWRELPTIGLIMANVIVPDDEAGKQVCMVTPSEKTGCWDDDEPYLGPPSYRINTKWAITKPEMGGSEEFPISFLFRFICRNIIPFFRGERGNPYPYNQPPPGQAQVRMETRPRRESNENE